MTWFLGGVFWLALIALGAIVARIWWSAPPGSRLAWIGNGLIMLLILIIGIVLFVYPVR